MQTKNPRVTQLNNDYVHQMEARRRYRIQVHVRRAKVIYGVFLVVLLFFGFQLWRGHHQLAQVNQTISQQRATLSSQRATGRQLERKVQLLHNPDYLQQVLRDKYNYAKQGETIYNFAD